MMWKETDPIFFGRIEENHEDPIRIVGVPVGAQIGDLSNTITSVVA
jgi:hypothetical protein